MIKLLVKNRLRGTVSGMLKQGKRASKGKIALFAVLFAYLFACVIFLSATFAYMLGSVLIPTGAAWLYFAMFILASFSAVFLLSIFETKSELFDCKDNDLLLSMPIPEKALVISRTIVVLIFNYLIQALVILPAAVVYAIISRDAIGVIGVLAVSLFTPLLATALSTGVGYLVARVSKRTNKSTLITIILSLAFIFLYFWGYNALITGIEGFLANFNPEELKGNLKIVEFIGNAALLNPISLISLIAVCTLLSFFVYCLIARNYISMATNNRGAKKIKYEARKINVRSPLFALCKKELNKFFTSSMYMLNSGIGLVFTVILSVVAVINKPMLAEISTALFGGENYLAPALAIALVFLSSMNMMSASALSLEGKKLWVLKTIPVKDSTVILSKVLPQIIVTTPPVLISSILMIIASGAEAIYWPFIILTPFLANVAFAFLGLIFNILFPKFDFDNEVQPVKQGLASFLTMLTQMIISILALVITVALMLLGLPLISALAGFALFLLLSAVFALILFIPCKQKYAKI